MKNLKEISIKSIPKIGNKVIDSCNLYYCKSLTTSFLDNLKNKKVLVLGSGPSAVETDWQSKEWDVLVTTSHFYKVPEILEQKPTHVSVSNTVDLKNKKFLNYLDNNPNCTIGFQEKIYQRTKNVHTGLMERYSLIPPNKQSRFFIDLIDFKEKYKDRIVYYQTFNDKCGHKAGIGSRVCYPVLMAKPKSLTICGIDGYSKNIKEDPPNYFKYSDNNNISDKKLNIWPFSNPFKPLLSKEEHSLLLLKHEKNYNIFKKSYEEFGERLYTIGHHYNIPIYNLGKGKPYNMITPISEKYEKS